MSETMRKPATSKGATEAPTCIPLYKGKIYIKRWIYIYVEIDY